LERRDEIRVTITGDEVWVMGLPHCGGYFLLSPFAFGKKPQREGSQGREDNAKGHIRMTVRNLWS
jgi:hypothetical protein